MPLAEAPDLQFMGAMIRVQFFLSFSLTLTLYHVGHVGRFHEPL
jgi:hypothetical protein